MKIRVTNQGQVDELIDRTGNNKIEDKVILHPRNTARLIIEPSQLQSIKANASLIVQVLGE